MDWLTGPSAKVLGTELFAVDLVVIVGYLVGMVGIGLWFARRASRSTSEYFLAGRTLPWWIAGTSIVATTFSTDTPLQVVGQVRSGGIWENWWWWSLAAGHVISAFLFAPLWRRSELTTDVEFMTFRYDGAQARVLRILDGLYQGLLVNSCVIAAVSVGLAKILAAMLNIDPGATVDVAGWISPDWVGAIPPVRVTMLLVGGCAAMTIFYSLLSGLYGVSYSDLPQFVIAMIGAIVLAVVVVTDMGGLGSMLEQVRASPAYHERSLRIMPDLSMDHAVTFTIMVYFLVNWWSRVPGHGSLAQRLLASRSERDGMLAMVWFAVANYCLRPWPWIIVGVASIAVLPAAADHEAAYPGMIAKFMHPGLRGLMVVSFLAAFMSTVDTHVNLASAYLVNDFYRPLVRGRSERHYVRVGRLMMIPVLGVLLMIASGIEQIDAVYKFLLVLMAGTATVSILRWYWWRINAWTEIASMATAIVVGAIVANVDVLNRASEPVRDAGFGYRMMITVSATTAAWMTVMFCTRPVGTEQLVAFYRKVRPGGPGWRRIAALCPDLAAPSIRMNLLCSALGIVMIYAGIVSVGELLLGDARRGLVLVAVAMAAGVGLGLAMRGLARPGPASAAAGAGPSPIDSA